MVVQYPLMANRMIVAEEKIISQANNEKYQARIFGRTLWRETIEEEKVSLSTSNVCAPFISISISFSPPPFISIL